MNGALSYCPHCQMPLNPSDEERFCSNCRHELPAQSASANQTQPPDREASRIESDVLSDKPTTSDARHTPPVPVVTVNIPATETPQLPKTETNLGDCRHWEVLYNTGKVFVEGVFVPFEFRLTPLVDGLDDLFVQIRRDDQVLVQKIPAEDPSRGREMSINLNFNAPTGLRGEFCFDIYIGYLFEDRPLCFTTHKVHRIFRAKEKAQTVINSLKFELKNVSMVRDIGNASDPTQSVQQKIEGLDKICKPDDPAEDFKYITIPAFWEKLPLHKCKNVATINTPATPHGKPLQVPPKEAHHDRLTLHNGFGTVHLLSHQSIVLGRNRTCDLVTRVQDNEGRVHEEPTQRISKFHCRISMEQHRVLVTDKGMDPEKHTEKASTSGTFVDGQRVKSGQSQSLPVDRTFFLSLGSDQYGDETVSAFEGRIWSCGQSRSLAPACQGQKPSDHPACLILRRLNGPAETFVVVYEHFVISTIDPTLKDACICRSQQGFLLKTAGPCVWLVPGNRVSLANKTILIDELNQVGLERKPKEAV